MNGIPSFEKRRLPLAGFTNQTAGPLSAHAGALRPLLGLSSLPHAHVTYRRCEIPSSSIQSSVTAMCCIPESTCLSGISAFTPCSLRGARITAEAQEGDPGSIIPASRTKLKVGNKQVLCGSITKKDRKLDTKTGNSPHLPETFMPSAIDFNVVPRTEYERCTWGPRLISTIFNVTVRVPGCSHVSQSALRTSRSIIDDMHRILALTRLRDFNTALRPVHDLLLISR